MEPADLLASTVDKSQVPPLHQKRMVAFINHFLINSCSFLNEFANQCETKFIDLERKMQRLEVALSIIESKLASIPEDKVASNATTNPNIANTEKPNKTAQGETEEPAEAITEPNTTNPSPTVEPLVRACEDVRYKMFFKMVQYGVQEAAVKIKMQAEGLDPSILDTPNLELADGVKS